ncbi:ATP-dependent RNA helicase DbpA [Woeseia oceani]|uniref:ATP-dependent RNA helicase DbpA n=1 Tax=Woeseia oceani TaxID=1548547 RepID=A0A193LJ73_9GAMM|nr:ATP-dependent RNA helicase DbpA [Woeseia oceani]ANO52498.1 ATP-dependent RNA helicase DbpA [Woeseia oceani]
MTFSALDLKPALLDNLAGLGYLQMTPIQSRSLPPILAGQDVIGQAKTGSGKTAAFGLGLLNTLDSSNFRTQALVLCPTRELADQVAVELRRLARGIPNIKILTVCGGKPFRIQAASIDSGAHIVVGTPGRIEDHLRKSTLELAELTTLVLDEADRMLDMGFQDSLDYIVGQTPAKRQTLLFSATYPDEIQSIAGRVLTTPVHIKVEETHGNATIRQQFFEVQDDEQRLRALRLLLLENQAESTLVFCNTKVETRDVAGALRQAGFSVLAIHGDLEQRDRDSTLVRFAHKSVSVLVATDVAARGLDIDALDVVINYRIAHESEIHLHRIGRTGRAGGSGVACTLFSASEAHKVAALQEYTGTTVAVRPLPDDSVLKRSPGQPAMESLQIDGGKKQKIRPGDILGALTGDNGIAGDQVGKISIFDMRSFVAVRRSVAAQAVKKLMLGKLKGKSFRVRQLRGHP